LTRDEVLAALDASDGAVKSRLTVESAERFGEWTAKDLLFHVTAWVRFFGVTLRTRREAGREPTAAELLGQPLDPEESERVMALDTEGTNAYFFELYRDAAWTVATNLWTESFALLRDEVGRLSDAHLAEGEPLWRRIGLESFTHIAGHLAGPDQGVG
jgi:hypothetical protein